VNAAPGASALPSMSPVHQPRTFVMALKTSAGEWSTVKDVVKF
jgi:hypothetical protein